MLEDLTSNMIIHPSAFYPSLIALVTLRAFYAPKDGAKNTWLRDLGIAVLVLVVAAFIPAGSNGMAILLAVGFLMGTIALASLLISRFGHGFTSFSGKFLVLCVLSLVALFVAAVPLLLMAWWVSSL